MSFFSNDHVLQAGLQGSAGPEVGFWDMVSQGFQSRYQVNSPLSLDQELATRWQDSLQALREHGQNFDPPTSSEIYRRYAEFVRHGTPVAREEDEINPMYLRGGAPPPQRDFENMQRADEALRQLNDPNVRTFAQILQGVESMQRDTEERTASMSERTGVLGTVGGFLGDVAGSFTLRDPVNLATAPVGWGRTIAMRIATDMGVAGATTALSEFTDVNPNRALVGLPENNAYADIAASMIGAGLIRGGIIEPFGAAFHHLRSVGEDINFDLRDSQLQQMFAANDHSPSARAASSILDDTIVFEHSNPYGEGQVAGYRWQAELDATARALNGEEMAPLDLPPLPSEYIDRHLSFQSVKETAPELWNELEAARTRLANIDRNIVEATAETPPDLYHGSQRDDLTLENINPDRIQIKGNKKNRTYGGFYATDELKTARSYASGGQGFDGIRTDTPGTVYSIRLRRGARVVKIDRDIMRLSQRDRDAFRAEGVDVLVGKASPLNRVEHIILNKEAIADFRIYKETTSPKTIPDAVRLIDPAAADRLDKLSEIVNDPNASEPVRTAVDIEAQGIIARIGQDKIMQAVDAIDTAAKFEVRTLRASRKAANKAYRAAYQKVEAEAVRLEHAEAAKRSIAQTQSIDVLGPHLVDEPLTGPMTRFDFVEEHGAKVTEADAAIPAKAEAVNDLQINPETNTVDIGTKTPVSADFKVPFDEGELSVREVLDDLAEDQRLEEAVKGCSI